MARYIYHPSDDALLRVSDDGESPRRLTMLDRHLADCAACRERRRELHAAADEFFRACRAQLSAETPATERLRERLRANVTRLSHEMDRSWRSRIVRSVATAPRATVAAAAALAAVLCAAVVVGHRGGTIALEDAVAAVEAGALPVQSLTPGATRPVGVDELCGGGGPAEPPVSTAVRQAVLRDYRMEGVPAHEYELDYLITPELGGTEDRRNLWPERYSPRVWNARVKDELEQLLPQLVCRGQVDLATAQRDLADNWINAYKKYFHTDRPVPPFRDSGSHHDSRAPTLVSFVTRAGGDALAVTGNPATGWQRNSR